MNRRSLLIQEKRRKQPIAELQRKWDKAKGRHSNHYWTVEWLDLCYAKAEELCNGINWQ